MAGLGDSRAALARGDDPPRAGVGLRKHSDINPQRRAEVVLRVLPLARGRCRRGQEQLDLQMLHVWLDEWAERDPLKRLADVLRSRGLIDEAGLSAIQTRVHEDFQRAVELARQAPQPDVSDLTTDVLV